MLCIPKQHLIHIYEPSSSFASLEKAQNHLRQTVSHFDMKQKKNGNHFIRLDFFFGKMAMHSSDPSISKPISDVESVRTPNEYESLKSCSSKNSKKKSNILVQSVATARVEFVRVKIVLHHMPLLCN